MHLSTFEVERSTQMSVVKVFVYLLLDVNGLIVNCRPWLKLFALTQLSLNVMKTVCMYLSEFSKQIVLNSFEHRFHIMASFSWQALLFHCRTSLHCLCEAFREMIYRCISPVANSDKIHTIERMTVKYSTWKPADYLNTMLTVNS